MLKIELNEREELSDREIAFILLADACGKVLGYPNLYPKQIFHIAYRYLHNGCNTRYEYEYLVSVLIENTHYRKELLKWLIMI